MKIKYVGPHASITVEVDKTVIEVDRDEPFDVPDAEGKRLCEQDIWEQVGKALARARKREAPAKQVVETDEASADAEPNKED